MLHSLKNPHKLISWRRMPEITLYKASQIHPEETFSRFFQALDCLPILSTGKGIVDLFATKYWRPSHSDQLTPYFKAYYHHLSEKDDFSYVAMIPFVGNTIIALQRCYHFVIRQKELLLQQDAESGQREVIEKLYQGSAEQKAKALEYSYQSALSTSSAKSRAATGFLLKILNENEAPEKEQVLAWFSENVKRLGWVDSKRIYEEENIPPELRVKIVDYYISQTLNGTDPMAQWILSYFMKTVHSEEKQRILSAIKAAAESGNLHAFEFMKQKSLSDSSSENPYFQWIVQQAESLSSPLNEHAWTALTEEYYVRENAVFSSYQKMLQMPNLPIERFSFITNQFDKLSWIGTPEQKVQILAAYEKIAETGHVKIMHKVACMYQREGDENRAMLWFEKAAQANHLSSILKLAKLHIYRNDVKTSTFWLLKAEGRCKSFSKALQFNSVAMLINLHNNAHTRAEFENKKKADFNAYFSFNSEAKKRAHHESHQGRTRAEDANANDLREQAALVRAELTGIIGAFSNAKELDHNWRKWGLKGHPDKGGCTEEFTRVAGLMAAVKEHMKAGRYI